MTNNCVVGLRSKTGDLQDLVRGETSNHFNYFTVPLFHPSRNHTHDAGRSTNPATRSDLSLSSHEWSQRICGMLSPWLSLDSECQCTTSRSLKALSQELAWASHLGLNMVSISPDTADRSTSWASALLPHAIERPGTVICVNLPILRADPLTGETSSTWNWWRKLRACTESHPNVALSLTMTADVPEDYEIDRWFAEPVKVVVIPTSVFLYNKGGFPVLSRKHQAVIQRLLRLGIRLELTGRPRHAKGWTIFVQYLRHLFDTMPPLTSKEEYESPFFDYLQIPLQPLADNLESGTYEVFEQDPVKYVQYEKAVFKALLDRYDGKDGKCTQPSELPIIMVVGAGRGPLVQASLNAASSAGIDVQVFAVEKNPNAVITLKSRLQEPAWVGRVTVISTDMRAWKTELRADIMVSELLGSFGDNELSPECLDGAQSFLKDDGINIPQWYTATLAPIQSVRLWQEVHHFDKLKNFETTYVVRMFAHNQLAKSKECWTFSHPNKNDPIDNTRECDLTFSIGQDCTIHGLAGFFDCCLYADEHISIDDRHYSEEMFSWFPLYFPIRTPVEVVAGDCVRVRVWRRVSETKVWYEWSILEPVPGPVHNPGGRSQHIGL